MNIDETHRAFQAHNTGRLTFTLLLLPLPTLPDTPLHPWRPKSTQYTLTEDLLDVLGKHPRIYQPSPRPPPPLPPRIPTMLTVHSMKYCLAACYLLVSHQPYLSNYIGDRGNKEKEKAKEIFTKHLPCANIVKHIITCSFPSYALSSLHVRGNGDSRPK